MPKTLKDLSDAIDWSSMKVDPNKFPFWSVQEDALEEEKAKTLHGAFYADDEGRRNFCIVAIGPDIYAQASEILSEWGLIGSFDPSEEEKD